jgi:uncharacterized protein involved in exopolysaccharide biosynthesis/Mrp family chromosome partitioning ATPase
MSRISSNLPVGLDDDTVDIWTVFSDIWRRKAIIALCAILGGLIGYVLVSQVTPQYTSRSAIMLDPRSVQVFSFDDVVSETNVNNLLLDTETAVLRSNILLERVIASFDPKRLSPIDPALQPPSLGTRLRQSIGSIKDTVVSLLGGDPGDMQNADAHTELRMLLSEEERLARRLLGGLRESMTVRRDGQSYLISVSVETSDPELSMLLSNAVVTEYIAAQVERRTGTLQDASGLLENRVLQMRLDLEIAEEKVEDFRLRQLELGRFSQESMAQQMQDLSTQIAVARANLAGVEARFSQITSLIETSGIKSAAEVLTSPFVVSLRDQKSQLERSDAERATRYGPEHPDRQRIAAEIALIDLELSAEVEKIVGIMQNEVRVARISEQSLLASLAEVEARSADIARQSVELRQLEREADVARSSYEATLARLSETQALQELSGPSIRLVERAIIPGAPSAPRPTLVAGFGAAVGLSLGIALAYILAVSRSTFRRVVELERTTGLAVIGSLGKGRWRNVKSMLRSFNRDPNQKYIERLRQIRDTLHARPDQSEPLSILVTSSIQDEGKTTMSFALAHLEGNSRRRALVIDMDARKTGNHHEVSYNPPNGDLLDYLDGNCSFDDTIYSKAENNFDLISTRRTVSNLSDVLSQGQITRLIQQAKASYDTVIIDTPPLLLVSDGLALVREVDKSILLVRQGSTKRAAVFETLKMLRGVRSLALVMTMVNVKDEEGELGISGDGYYA